jgi:hypothetical protein
MERRGTGSLSSRVTGGTSAVDRGERGMKRDKKKFNCFHRTCGMCGELTAQPHVRRTCGPVRHPWTARRSASAPSQSQVNVGASARLSSQDGVSHQQENASLSLPQLNRLFEASFVRDESSVSNADVAVIPSQHRVTQEILSH